MTLPPATPPEDKNAVVKEGETIKSLQRAQWIRAAILGANDGLMSTTALMLGVGAAKDDRRSMITSGLAGALAGACSMAVGEFVSVSTQRDIEKTMKLPGTESLKEIKVVEETGELKEKVLPELPQILSPGRSPIMKVVTEEMGDNGATKSPPNGTGRGRDGDRSELLPNPYKAAGASGLAFLCGSFVPLVPATIVAEHTTRIVVVVLVASVALAIFGGLGAHLGGSKVGISGARVLVGGWMAMGITYSLLKPFDKD